MTVWNDLKRPVNIVSLSIGLLSIIVSLFIYFASLKSREPVFLIDEQRGKIFDSKISALLSKYRFEISVPFKHQEHNGILKHFFTFTVTL